MSNPNIIHRLAYVVPTKDHPDDLRILFNSLEKQTVFPHQLIIVDGSQPDIKYVCDEYPDLPITYERCFPPSLAKQRNAYLQETQEFSSFVLHLIVSCEHVLRLK